MRAESILGLVVPGADPVTSVQAKVAGGSSALVSAPEAAPASGPAGEANAVGRQIVHQLG